MLSPRSALRLMLSPALLTCISAAAPALQAQTAPPAKSASPLRASAAELRASRAFDAARASKTSALQLHAFLARMPKGADLHMHLSGAIYAETFLKDAAADNLCVNTSTLSFTKNIGLSKDTPARPVCLDGAVPAASVFGNQKLYDSLVDSFSMRGYVPSPGITGHDQFFATFDRYGGTDKSHTGEWMDEVATRAAAQNEQYLEVMITPSFFELAKLWNTLGWPATPPGALTDPTGDATGTAKTDLNALRLALLAGGLRDEVAVDTKQLDGFLADRDRIEHCGQPEARPACSVKIRVIYQVLRAFSPQQVFAQTLLAFEVASADPRIVGLNFVQPEDAYMAMSEYHRQMLMLDFLHGLYPKVHISLHAGELASGLVPPAGLQFHIREAVDLGHAERIGHGVDVMYESEPQALLQEMADRHIMVEINLTSNDVILGIKPPNSPFPEYRAAHVPVALSTDDEGVSRIDLTHEYVRAATEYGLTYLDLKNIARSSIEHSFLPGDSLWDKPDVFAKVTGSCAGQPSGSESPTADCLSFLKASEKAAQQWELEHRFAVFEAGVK